MRPNDKFMIVASDGVWEFLESEEVVEIIGFYREKGDIEGACDHLMRESLERWRIEEDENIDDITFVLVFFENSDECLGSYEYQN